MLERFRAFWTAIWAPLGNLLIRWGVSPNTVTFVGTLGVVAGALIFFPTGHLFTGVMVVTAFVFSDMIDGYMARTTGNVSLYGNFLDSTLDRIGDAAIFGGLALYYVGDPDWSGHAGNHWFAALAMYCLSMGSVTSYARAKAESLGMQAKVGIAERADRLVFILVTTGVAALLHSLGVPGWILWATPVMLGYLAFASTVTVAQRIHAVHLQSREITRAQAAGAAQAE
jgi:CDP-diacylglycerol--glycerol-3-phosphate 3-phosphatidyltransferase/CDP-diacylglycerol--inositol 3-phosphatidyltransferase